MSDILIVHQFENMIINVFGMHFDFIILHVSTIMEVPLLGLQIGPCLKCDETRLNVGVRACPSTVAAERLPSKQTFVKPK